MRPVHHWTKEEGARIHRAARFAATLRPIAARSTTARILLPSRDEEDPVGSRGTAGCGGRRGARGDCSARARRRAARERPSSDATRALAACSPSSRQWAAWRPRRATHALAAREARRLGGVSCRWRCGQRSDAHSLRVGRGPRHCLLQSLVVVAVRLRLGWFSSNSTKSCELRLRART